ncbi:hypothetical protein JHK87_003654 [Glycine soja]|nr:hypothetical protein JHK87_003654 [Glycine soja]
MAEAVLEIVLENLNSLVQKELGLFLGFNQDMARLASLLITIKATLEDAVEKQFSNRAVKDWLGKLKDAAHILDDILDECQGGLGKTTLAQLIFNHEKVANYFELRIWVCVLEDFSLKRMTKAITEATSGCHCEDLDIEPLQRELQALLQRKRYLLVLDDVWDDEQENWGRLKSVLVYGTKGSSILVTTRLLKVTTIMVEQVEFVVIGKEIVRKCGGDPLAAKALKGIELRQLYLSPKVVKQFNTLEISTTAIFQLLHLTIKLTSSNKEVDFPKEFNNNTYDCFGNLVLLRKLTVYNCSKLRCPTKGLSLSRSDVRRKRERTGQN